MIDKSNDKGPKWNT